MSKAVLSANEIDNSLEDVFQHFSPKTILAVVIIAVSHYTFVFDLPDLQ